MKLTWQPGSWKSGVLALANFHTCCWVEGVWWEPECHTHEQICRQSSQSEADKRQTRIVVFLFCYYFIYLFFCIWFQRAPQHETWTWTMPRSISPGEKYPSWWRWDCFTPKYPSSSCNWLIWQHFWKGNCSAEGFL